MAIMAVVVMVGMVMVVMVMGDHLQLLLSFPTQAHRMSSIGKACVLILRLYVRHLAALKVFSITK